MRKYFINKRLLIEILRQKLAQTENLTEVQLKDILDKLESQKAKLPLEDHSIIDWGINAIRVRMQQEEQLMSEVQDNLERMRIAITEKWNKMTNPRDIYELFGKNLPEIMNQSVDLKYEEGAGKVISALLKCLREHKNIDDESLETILKNMSKFCSDKVHRHSKNNNKTKDECGIKKTTNLAILYARANETFSKSLKEPRMS